MKNKKVWLGLTALVLVAALMLGIYLGMRPEAEDGTKEFTVLVVHKSGEEKQFAYATEEDYLGPVMLAEGLIQGEEGAYGLMVTSVDGETADWNVDQSYWALFVGTEYATTGVDTTPVTDGGEYSLVYTIG